jgi:hypothetical protein
MQHDNNVMPGRIDVAQAADNWLRQRGHRPEDRPPGRNGHIYFDLGRGFGGCIERVSFSPDFKVEDHRIEVNKVVRNLPSEGPVHRLIGCLFRARESPHIERPRPACGCDDPMAEGGFLFSGFPF